ncbi:MAG: tRNA lysidine(34) synthetase TilS, partial [Candidatus Phytoplasma stylosanthis]|nr:tRNA lysidine(34) synthetase TilS [Candidatus Phytoplasma stylosanthis]
MVFNLSYQLDQKNVYIISVSGGVDSMVLLDYLYHLKYSLIVVHFNHLKRNQSFEEKKIVEQYCFLKKIPFHYFELKIEEKDFQNQARSLRKEKLKKVAVQYKTFYLMTAHHLDDLSETILFKIARGSSILGYSGMQPFFQEGNFYFVKPFLYVPKQKIINYARDKKILFLEDHTNQLNLYNRNKIRNKIIPFFKQMNNFLKNITKFHFQLTEINNFIRKQTILFVNIRKDDVFDLNLFLTLDISIQKDIILFFLKKKKIKKSFDLINNIVKFLKNRSKANASHNFNSGWAIFKKY